MKQINVRAKAYHLLEDGFSGSIQSKILSGFIVLLIIANVAAVIVESYAPLGKSYEIEFFLFNLFSVLIFTVEYFARVWACIDAEEIDATKPIRSRIGYMMSPVALIDLLAVLPFYLSFIFSIDLRYLRMLRMLRLLKLTHYFKGLNLFIHVLKQELATISAALFIMMILVIFSASIIYGVEHAAQPEVFDSIPSAIWWAVVTMTTVGYGDVIPVTLVGKFIAIFIMLLGVGVVALPAAMLAARFGEELRIRKSQLEIEVDSALEDGVITETERASLDTLADELNISKDALDKLISIGLVKQSCDETCPHCKQVIHRS